MSTLPALEERQTHVRQCWPVSWGETFSQVLLGKDPVALKKRCLRRQSPSSDVSSCLGTEESTVTVVRKKKHGLRWHRWTVGISLI